MQNKVKIIIYTLSILLLSFTKAYSSETKLSNPPEMKDARFACKIFFENLAKSENTTVRNFYTYAIWNDFGFYLKEVFDEKEYKFKAFKDKDNNLVVGPIYNFDTASKINAGDSILSINNKRRIFHEN